VSNQHAAPLLLRSDRSLELLTRLPLAATDSGVIYDEAYLEELLFEHPEILPIREIDAAYLNPIPICTQLATRVGPLDVLYITSEGRLVIVEAKLWRNPEQRRKVVGQIIDYAAELSRWRYEDLEREVAKRAGVRHSLHSLVAEQHQVPSEADFVDSVSRSLREGRFLLLICGDGVREELASIAEFLTRNTTLDLTFGLLELAIFSTSDGNRLILPRVLAKTVTIARQVVKIEASGTVVVADDREAFVSQEPASDRSEPTEQQANYLQFWAELAGSMRFDDGTQSPITVARAPNTTLRMPSKQAWITLYLAKSSNTM
jgi:hypothetical protein